MFIKGCSPDNPACEEFLGRLKKWNFYDNCWLGITIKRFIDLLDEYIDWDNNE